MTLFNYFPDNGLLTDGIVVSGLLAIGFSLHYFIDYNSANNSISDFDYLNTDLSPTSNVYSSVGTQTVPDSVNTASTVLPIPSTHVEVVSNLDIDVYNAHKAIQESKFHEFKGLYSNVMFDNAVSDADLEYIVKSFTVEELNSSDIYNIVLSVLSCFKG
jgi:hypothetical protein